MITDHTPSEGERYRIPKGARVHATHPREHYDNPRTRTVTASGFRSNYGDLNDIAVEWVGNGGYWFWCFEWGKA